MSNKSITKNSFYNVIYQGFNVLFPLISITYFSRILTAAGIGKIEYSRTIVAYFSILAALGIPIYGVKIVAQAGDDIMEKSRSFWEMFYLNACSTIICSISYYIFISVNNYFSGRKFLFYVMGSLLISNIANIDWYYQGIEDYVYITKRSIITKILSFTLMIIFVNNSEDYILYAEIFCIASICNYVFNIIHIKNQIKFISITDCKISRHIAPIMTLLCSNIATEIYTMLDSVILEYFHGEIYVGYYSNCVKIVRLVYALSTAIVITFYPRISLYIKEDKSKEINDLISTGCKVLLIFATPAATGIFLTSDSLIPVLFGTSFLPSIGCLRILSILVIIFAAATILGHIVLIASGNENVILVATVSGAVINAMLNVTLIPNYRHYGAAIASVIAESLVTAIMLTMTMKSIKLNIEKSFISSFLISLAIMILSVEILKNVKFSPFIQLISCTMFGITAYFASLILLKNTIALYICSKIKTMIEGIK